MSDSDPGASGGGFPRTCWLPFEQLRDDRAEPAAEAARAAARETICGRYLRPTNAFLRRAGYSRDDAADLAQGFFADLLRHNTLSHADPAKGRFRCFLIGALKRYVRHSHRDAVTIKRGGGRAAVEFDEAVAGGSVLLDSRLRPAAPPAGHPDAEWADQLHRRTMRDLAQEYRTVGKREVYEALRPSWSVDGNPEAMERISRRLGRPVATLRSDLCRIRGRYRELLCAVLLAETPHADVREELRHFLAALASRY
jgi:RNA polymerase sigma-70 factor (ECF subfamily)